MEDAFEALARSCDLNCRAQPICSAPRDVLAPLDATEQHYLVSLSKRGNRAQDRRVRMVFAKPLTESGTPTVREVLWWLAGDAFALEQADGQLAPWAASYGHAPEDPGADRLFQLHRDQADQLRTLLGEVAYRRLLELYVDELSHAPA